jgi:hypothetical protein
MNDRSVHFFVISFLFALGLGVSACLEGDNPELQEVNQTKPDLSCLLCANAKSSLSSGEKCKCWTNMIGQDVFTCDDKQGNLVSSGTCNEKPAKHQPGEIL